MKGKSKDRRGEAGFSLIEVMVAILILAVGLLTLAQMMAIATNANALSGRMTATAALAKEQLELLKAAPFYRDPVNINQGSVNAMLRPGGDINTDQSVGGVDYFQYYDENGKPMIPNQGAGAMYVVRWRIDRVVPPGGNGVLPLSTVRITVRCQGAGYRVLGDATFQTFRTANVG